MTLGLAERQSDLLDPVVTFCDEQVDEDSIYGLLHRERERLFPDEMFADLYESRGRRSLPPSILACVLVLQRLEGLSDREAAERFTFDARWRYACGVGDWSSGPVSFVHTVLVRFRMRLEASDDPKRIFRVSTAVAAEAGLVGVRRVLDSAPLFDAVATMDTVTLVRSAIRGLLRAVDPATGRRLRGVLSGEDDYAGAGKPACDWDDEDARVAVVDRLARDGLALLGELEGEQLSSKVVEAVELLAMVVGQDLEEDDDGTFRIVRGVARDRIISTVDPDARHGHKTSARKFDGYKGHAAVDPDSEIITATAVGPANGGDAAMTAVLTADLAAASDAGDFDPDGERDDTGVEKDPAADTNDRDDDGDGDGGGEGERAAVYGDAAYGSGDNLAEMEERNLLPMFKVQPPASRGGLFTKDDFAIDLDADVVACPAGQIAVIARAEDGSGVARFGSRCDGCLKRAQCTTAKSGRTISIHPREALLVRVRREQQDPQWQADYRATRPKVERKLAHMLRAGRRAQRRGLDKVDVDWSLTGTGVNLARMAAQGLRNIAGSWQIASA